MHQAVILCGGLGTRLGPLTATLPKPLLPVGERPFLDTLLFEAGRHGFKEIVLLAGFAAKKIREYARTTNLRKRFSLELRVAAEASPAGTGGALWQARDLLDNRFLLLNGDTWFDINLLDLAQRAADEQACVAKLALRHVSNRTRYGIVETAGEKILRFAAHPHSRGPALVNAGVAIVRRELIGRLSAKCSLEMDVWPMLAQSGELACRIYGTYFIDIGVPTAYRRAQKEIPKQRQRPAAFLSCDRILHGDKGDFGIADDLSWPPGAINAIKQLNDRGLYVFVVTNSTEHEAPRLQELINQPLRKRGAHVDDIRNSFYRTGTSIDHDRQSSSRPKSHSGMLLDLMNVWQVDQQHSFLIGANEIDIETAQCAGIPGYLFRGGSLDCFVTRLKR